MDFLSMASVLMGLLEMVIPKIAELAKKGEITAGQQKDVKDRYEKLKGNLDDAFSGPEWKIE